MEHAHDLVIRGGLLIDGTGAAAREADIAIKDGRVVGAGQIGGKGREEIDARGQLGHARFRRHPHPL